MKQYKAKSKKRGKKRQSNKNNAKKIKKINKHKNNGKQFKIKVGHVNMCIDNNQPTVQRQVMNQSFCNSFVRN